SVHRFAPLYQNAWLREFGAKLGLAHPEEKDRELAERLLTIMARQKADFTRVFHGLSDSAARDEFTEPAAFDEWATSWRSCQPDPDLMAKANPARIPRNHRIEQVIAAAVAGDRVPFETLCDAVTHPRETRSEWDDFALPPKPDETVRQTFCG